METHITRVLRKNQTPWEGKLWNILRGGRFYGLKFRRQFKTGKFVVDFCCLEKKLVVELDGSQHNTEEMRSDDEKRENCLKNKGYKILRFWNNDIDSNLEGVLETIREAIGRI